MKARIQRFLNELQLPKTRFCRGIGISTQALNAWLRDDLKLADSTLKRIDEYLKRYGFWNEVNIIERTDRLKERVEDFLHENEMNGLQFCKASNISINKFYFWMNSDFTLDTLTRSAIVGYLNTHK